MAVKGNTLMRPYVEPVSTAMTFPHDADVVIIGGGIVGISAAYALACDGLRVVLCEKGVVAGEQSSRNWGWVRRNGRDPREIPLMLESFRLWKEFRAQGVETGFSECGTLILAGSEADVARQARFIEDARPYGLGSEMLSGAALRARLPGYGGSARSGLFNAGDGRAEPGRAVPAIARAAMAEGAVIVQSCAVRGIDRKAGRVCGVVTESGYIRASQVVVAGGAWSRMLLQPLGVTLPQLRLKASVCRTAPVEGLPEISAYFGDVACRRREDGGYTIAPGSSMSLPINADLLRFSRLYLPAAKAQGRVISPCLDNRSWRAPDAGPTWDVPGIFERTRILSPRPDITLTRRRVQRLQSYFPHVKDLRIIQHWAGLIDVMPDAVPVIDTNVGEVAGLSVATGFSGHGFGIGPGAGRLVADLVQGRDARVNPRPFRLARFFDSSAVQIVAGF